MSDATDNVVLFPKWPTYRPRLTADKLRGRLGRFVVPDQAIQVWPDLVQAIMARVIVLQAGRCQEHGHTMYFATSEQFDEIVDGDGYPAYEWRFENGQMRAYRLPDPT